MLRDTSVSSAVLVWCASWHSSLILLGLSAGWTRVAGVCAHYTYIENFCIGLRALLGAPGPPIFGPPGAPSGVEIRFSGCPFEEPDHRQKNYCPNDGVDNFRADAADENKPNPRQEPAGNEGANNADHDVADEPEAVALHD